MRLCHPVLNVSSKITQRAPLDPLKFVESIQIISFIRNILEYVRLQPQNMVDILSDIQVSNWHF